MKEYTDEIIFTKSGAEGQALNRALKKGKVQKLAPRIYSANLSDSAEKLIKKHLFYILSHFYSGAVISHRSALEGGLSKDGVIVLTYRYTRNVKLPGVVVKLVQGPGPLNSDTVFLKSLYISSRARALLENCQPSRKGAVGNKALALSEVEAWLDKMARVYGIAELNRLRDEARIVANELNYQNEYVRLDKCIASILGTGPADLLVNKVTQSRALGQAYDPNRLELFSVLFMSLENAILDKLVDSCLSIAANKNIAFYDSYFSNFIEGTEFEIEEAEQIIFGAKIISSRPQDSHDILGAFKILNDPKEMATNPENIEDLLLILKHRHLMLMSARPEKSPGEFKNTVNRVGNTVFVKPDEVVGTLAEGFALYKKLPAGIKRAIFMMFLVSEVHPFLDGNGRLARVMMNAELFFAGESRIIIPTVYREDYLLALRKLSREYEPAPYIKMLTRAQRWTASLNFNNYETALKQLKLSNAFLLPNEGQLQMLW